jgi:hypothetical protein
MADRARKVNYCYLIVPSRAGQGTKVLTELKEAGVNLLAFTGFPVKTGKAQLDLVNGWRLSKTKKGFLIQGDDVVGAAQRHIQRLADEKINVTAANAVAAGKGRYGMLLWVKPKVYARAARALRAK